MSGYLPYGTFKWLKNVDGFDINSISEKSPIWYFLNVDLEYPDELHVIQWLSIISGKTCQIIVKKLQTNMK